MWIGGSRHRGGGVRLFISVVEFLVMVFILSLCGDVHVVILIYERFTNEWLMSLCQYFEV